MAVALMAVPPGLGLFSPVAHSLLVAYSLLLNDK